MQRLLTIGLLLGGLALAGCRGSESGKPPIHLNPNMDSQEKFDPQEPNPFFEDNRAMRPPVPGTVARGYLRENASFYEGRTDEGGYAEDIPMPVTQRLLERGQERFNIYCAVCHGRAGYGQGIITNGDYGYAPVPSYHQDRLREVSDGYLYDVITNGVRNMPPYAHQIPVADRWAIVAYVRALQRSQNARPEDVPSNRLPELQQRREAALEDTTGTTAAGDTTETAS